MNDNLKISCTKCFDKKYVDTRFGQVNCEYCCEHDKIDEGYCDYCGRDMAPFFEAQGEKAWELNEDR